MAFDALINEFAILIGIPDIEPEQGGVQLEIEDIEVALHHDKAFDRITLIADLGAFDADQQRAQSAKIAEMNFASVMNGGHTIAIQPDSGHCFILISLPLPGLKVDRLDAELALLMKRAKAAAGLLNAEKEALRSVSEEKVVSDTDILIRV